MNKVIVNKTINFISNYSNYSNEDLLKIKYGIEGIYLTITKAIIILLIGVIFNYIEIVLLTLLFFNILRFFAFGLHAKKSWQCLVMSIVEFNVLTFIFTKIDINTYFSFIIFIFSLISFILFSPSDTEKRPLTNNRKRLIRKIISILLLIVLFIISNQINFFKIPILCSFIIESILINPLTYKLLGLKYNNYKNKA